MNRIEERLQKLNARVERHIDNQFEHVLVHAEIMKLENCLRTWESFQRVPLSQESDSAEGERWTFKSWNGFKRDTKVSAIYQWFADSFHVDVRRDLMEQVD